MRSRGGTPGVPVSGTPLLTTGLTGALSASMLAAFPMTAYTPAITWPSNTVTAVAAQYLHTPGLLMIWGNFTESAGTTNSSLTIPLPGGFSVYYPVGALTVIVGLVYKVTGQVPAGDLTVTNGSTSMAIPLLTGAASDFAFQASIPVAT